MKIIVAIILKVMDNSDKLICWINKFRKNKVKHIGCFYFGRVLDQGNIKAFLEDRNSEKELYVSQLTDYFYELATKSIDGKYLKKHEKYHADKLRNEDKIMVKINNTRISTFFCFSDGERVLLFDRRSAKDSKLTTVQENDRWDCFGSVTFENISIKLKIKSKSALFEARVKDIKFIPGFAFEDNIEPHDSLFGVRTVIMFGFVIYVDSAALTAANSDSEFVRLYEIEGIRQRISSDALTSKAELALSYLIAKNCRREDVEVAVSD